VFVIAIFDPAIAERCPETLLPVAESLPGHLAKGKPARKSATSKTPTSVGTDGGILGSDIVGSLNTSDAKMISSQYVRENKCVVEPFVKSSRAQTADDSETWVEGAVNPTLNSFDQGDVRATTAIVEIDPIGTLQARQHKGANHEGARDGHLIVEEPVLFENSYRDGARIANDGVTQTLSAKMGTGGGNTPMIAVAYGIQGSMIGRQDHNGPAGKGHTEEGDPMFTLTGTDVHAVVHDKTIQYDGYNQTVNTTDVSQSLRIGRDSSDFIAQPTEPTMAVRRLTPLECERLMGWPDDHTHWKADGTEQADTHRYKQCGNGVASPVAQWIAKHLLKI
jgi:site-specific DNA-cytosine methylase